MLNKSDRKLNKILVDQGIDFYNLLTKSWVHDNSFEIYSTLNEGKSVVAVF